MILIPIKGLPLILPGMDLAQLIAQRFSFRNRDILVVSSCAVAKSQGRMVKLDEITPSQEAIQIAQLNNEDPRFVEVVLSESSEILIQSPFLLCVTRWGHVHPNAGVDRSNSPAGYVSLLPQDPDRAAQELRAKIQQLTGKSVGVIIADTCGRGFRLGQTGIALGCAGIQPIRDWRGSRDLYGYMLRVKQQAIVDELAGAANLIMGEGDWGIPAVVIRGYRYRESELGVRSMIRSDHQDLLKQALRLFRAHTSR